MSMRQSRLFEEIRDAVNRLPVIDAHEHWTGLCPPDPELDVLAFIADCSYYQSDLGSASWDFGDHIPRTDFAMSPLLEFLMNRRESFDARYNEFRKYHERTRHTSYTKTVFGGLKDCWGLDSVDKKALLGLQERMRAERGQKTADAALERHGIKGMIVNAITPLHDIFRGNTPHRRGFAKFVLDLPQYHEIFNAACIRKPQLESCLGKEIRSFDDYLQALDLYFEEAVKFGVVGCKDQSAYRRPINFGNPSRAAAESVFKAVKDQPGNDFETAGIADLEDYLFNYLIRLASRHGLPVQIHTGHMAGLRNDVSKSNPSLFTAVVERHPDVQFDLFHGGWPYMGEFLFLGKNHPNVNLNMCWANTIDPIYSIELMKRSIMTVPHSKMSGFGGDTHLFETQVGSLILARENICIAFTELVDEEWLSLDDVQEIAAAWLYGNPARLFSFSLK